MRYDFEEFLKDFLYAPSHVRDALMGQFYHGPGSQRLCDSVPPEVAEAIGVKPAIPDDSAKAHRGDALAGIKKLAPISAGEIYAYMLGHPLTPRLERYDDMGPAFEFYVASEVDAKLHEAESIIKELQTRIGKMRVELHGKTEEVLCNQDTCWDQGKRKEQ